MATHYAVMIGELGCYGRGTMEECQKIVNMHKTSKSGARKETMISGKAMTIDLVQGEYPDPNARALILNYKPGRA